MSTPNKCPGRSAAPDILLSFILAELPKITGLLNSNKSVTAVSRKACLSVVQECVAAATLLQKKQKSADPDATIITGASESDGALASIRDEIAKLREDLHRTSAAVVPGPPGPPTSYAAAAASRAGGTARPAIKTPRTRPAIIVQSGDSTVTSSKEVLSEWRKAVSFKDSSYAPAKVQVVSNNKVRVEFDSEVQRDETLRKLDLATSIRAEPARRRLPLVICKGVAKDIASDNLT